ncbi:MAG: sigma 54-interacting transcriptional regulator [Eubacterium sp.]|nr:sigma 54-interacting transcriptional regulator [Eubacterium sp.]
MNYRDALKLLAQCGIGAVVLAEDNIIHTVNEQAMRLLHGEQHAYLIGLSLAELAPELCVAEDDCEESERPEERPQYACAAFEEYLVRTPAPELSDLPEGMRLVTFRDATAEVQRNRYEHALEQIGDSIIMCDEKERIVFLNNAAIQMDGLVPQDVLGEKIGNVYEALDGRGLIIPRCIRERQVYLDRRQYYTTKYNKNVDITANTYPIIQDGQVLGGYSVMKDWSTVDNLNKKIVELQEKLLQQSQSGKPQKKSALTARYRFEDILHVSREMNDVLHTCRQAARSDSSVMIYGETGTGKELLAQSIHNASRRAAGPFLAINCAAIPENLLEGLLFGTEKGAFTGAERRPGLFEQASGGTLLLDELNSMNMNLQAKLLRVLQDGKVRRVGGSAEIQVDVRVISNLNIPPRQAIEEHLLRQDLFYRLGAVNLIVPPLRDRKADIPLLAKRFIMDYNAKLSRNVRDLSGDTLDLFLGYDWPGNVRELEHVIEHAINVLPDEEAIITPEYIPQYLQMVKPVTEKTRRAAADPVLTDSLNSTMKDVERAAICRVLRENGGNVSESARVLKMSRQSLQYRMRKYGIKSADMQK